MPTLLDDRLVADALTALTGWSGDAKRIVRTVPVSGASAEELLAEVAVTAEAMNHHPDVERSGGAIVFGLSTHSEGGVTEYDIAMASRIDDLISKVTGEGGGTVVGAPTAEGASEGGPHTGTGHRAGGNAGTDVDVPSEAGETADPGENLAGNNADRLEPVVGASAGHGTPSVPLPDTVPNAPQPGIGRPEGQGTPPAGQNVRLPADEGGPGDRP